MWKVALAFVCLCTLTQVHSLDESHVVKADGVERHWAWGLLADSRLEEGTDKTSEAGRRAGELGARFGATNKAKRIAKSIPRFGGVDKFEPENQNYWAGIIATIIPGQILTGVTVFLCFWFVVCRCCCNKCGGRKAKEKGYTKKQRFFPWVAAVASLAVAIVFCGLGFYNNDEFSRGFSGDEGVTKVAPNVLDGVDKFLSDVKVPLHDLSVEVPTRVDRVIEILQSTEVLATGTTGLTDRLDTLSSNMQGLTIVAGGETYPCDYCTTVSAKVAGISTEITTNSGPLFTDLSNVVDAVTDTLTGAKDAISASLNESAATADNTQVEINNVRGDVDDAMRQAEDADNGRRLAVTLLFVLPFVSLILVVVGGLCKLGILFRVNCCLSFVLSILMFQLFAFHLPASLLLGDVCVYMDEIEANMTLVFESEQAMIIDACLTNTSLVDALNLTDQINFRDQISFGEIPNVGDAFDFGELDTFKTEVDALTISTFGFDPATIDRALDQFTNNVSFTATPGTPVWTRENISTADGAVDTGLFGVDARNALRDSIMTLVNTEAELNAVLNDMRHNVSLITTYTDELKNNVTRVTDEVNEIEDIIVPLFDFIDIFLDLARCGFLGDNYYQLKTALCGTIATSFIMLSLCFFMVGIMGFPLMITSIILWKRIKNPRKKISNAPSPQQTPGTMAVQQPVVMMQPMQPVQLQTVQMQPMYIQQHG